jgi:hypothetical protein
MLWSGGGLHATAGPARRTALDHRLTLTLSRRVILAGEISGIVTRQHLRRIACCAW